MLIGQSLLAAIETAGLVGRGGAAFPVAKKWRRMQSLFAAKKYVVCNASEGEIGVAKDIHILKNFPEQVVKGLLLTMDFLDTKEAYINFNKNYYQQVKPSIDLLLESCRKKQYLVTIFQEEPSYIGGESGALLNAIEGRKTQPRVEPPSPSIRGIFGVPTLVHNVETLYDVARVAEGKHQPTRFSTILGVAREGVYEVSQQQSVAEILRQTDNYPDFPFFVQVGGGASGEIIRADQAETAILSGCGSIEVYPITTSAYFLLDKLSRFYAKESCGKCSPCREGSREIRQLVLSLDAQIANADIPWQRIWPLVDLMEQASLCGLGRAIAAPLKSYASNILGQEVL